MRSENNTPSDQISLHAAYVEAVEELERQGVDRAEAGARTAARLVVPFARGQLTAFYLARGGQECEFPVAAWQEPENAVAIFDEPQLTGTFGVFPAAAVGQVPYVHRHLFGAWLVSFVAPIGLKSSQPDSNGAVVVPDAPSMPEREDLRLHPLWTLPMSLAWLAWGDPERVGLFSQRMAFFFDRPMIGEFVLLHKNFAACCSLPELYSALMRALQKGRITATGVRSADGEGVSIPASQWAGLAFVLGSDDVAGYEGASRPTYINVRLNSASVLDAFPEALGAIAPIVVPLKKGPKLYDWGQFDAHLLSLVADLGLPGSDQPGWESLAVVEKRMADWTQLVFGKQPAESTIRKHCRLILASIPSTAP